MSKKKHGPKWEKVWAQEAKDRAQELPPYISVFHHQHGISVSVLPGGTSQPEYWEKEDGMESDRDDHYVEEFPLPDVYIQAIELLRSFYDNNNEWDADYMQSFADHARVIVDKAEGK